MQLTELQQYQRDYDKNFYEINSPDFHKIRHILLHLTKTNGKLAAYCEAKEHRVNQNTSLDFEFSEEIIPDLLLYALQLANIFEVDLDEAYLKHLEANKKILEKKRYAKFR